MTHDLDNNSRDPIKGVPVVPPDLTPTPAHSPMPLIAGEQGLTGDPRYFTSSQSWTSTQRLYRL